MRDVCFRPPPFNTVVSCCSDFFHDLLYTKHPILPLFIGVLSLAKNLYQIPSPLYHTEIQSPCPVSSQEVPRLPSSAPFIRTKLGSTPRVPTRGKFVSSTTYSVLPDPHFPPFQPGLKTSAIYTSLFLYKQRRSFLDSSPINTPMIAES